MTFPRTPARGSTLTARVLGDLQDARPISLSMVRTENKFPYMTDDLKNRDWDDVSSVWDEQSVRDAAEGWDRR